VSGTAISIELDQVESDVVTLEQAEERILDAALLLPSVREDLFAALIHVHTVAHSLRLAIKDEAHGEPGNERANDG